MRTLSVARTLSVVEVPATDGFDSAQPPRLPRLPQSADTERSRSARSAEVSTPLNHRTATTVAKVRSLSVVEVQQ
jgi:hypothetical protein